MILFSSPFALHAQSAADTLRKLARKTIAAAGSGEAIRLSFRNLSKIGAADAAALRQSLVDELRAGGARLSDREDAAEVRVTLSGNPAQYLLVAETHGSVTLLPIVVARRAVAAIAIEKTAVIEQSEPILDLAMDGANLLLLQPSKISYYTARGGRWVALRSEPLPAKTQPRDPRGMLRLEGDSFRAFVPGLACSGAVRPEFGAVCRESDAAWPLPLTPRFAEGRNYFDGRIENKTLPPFFSVAPAGGGWLFAGLDGRVSFHDRDLSPAGGFAGWGSDIAGFSLQCAGGAGQQVLATLPAGAGERDSVQAFEIVDGRPAALSAPVEFPGPIMALWPSGADTASVVSRDAVSGNYAAYTLTIACRD